MNKTPTKHIDNSYVFKPKEVTTPNRDCPGISKTVYTHVANLHNLLSDWEKLKEKGTTITKSVSGLKLHECTDDYYPHQLQPLMEGLLEALKGLQNIFEGVRIINTQLKALAALDKSNEGIISTWTIQKISTTVDSICMSLCKEIHLKETVTENLAHCRNENLIEVYVSAWELEAFYNIEMSAYLFADTGLMGIAITKRQEEKGSIKIISFANMCWPKDAVNQSKSVWFPVCLVRLLYMALSVNKPY